MAAFDQKQSGRRNGRSSLRREVRSIKRGVWMCCVLLAMQVFAPRLTEIIGVASEKVFMLSTEYGGFFLALVVVMIAAAWFAQNSLLHKDVQEDGGESDPSDVRGSVK